MDLNNRFSNLPIVGQPAIRGGDRPHIGPDILGIDAALRNTGIAIVRREGTKIVPRRWLVCKSKHRGRTKQVQGLAEMIVGIRDAVMTLKEEDFDPRICVVEQPKVYPDGNTKNPNDILMVGIASGAAQMACKVFFPKAITMSVNPHTWKGDIPKPVHNARMIGGLNMGPYIKTQKYSYPTCPPVVPGSKDVKSTADWEHLLDGAGLALFAIQNADTLFGKGWEL